MSGLAFSVDRSHNTLIYFKAVYILLLVLTLTLMMILWMQEYFVG